MTSKGEKLSKYFPWLPALPGSEKGVYFSMYPEYKTSWWRYMGFDPDPGPSWNATDFDFDHDYKRTGVMDAIVSGYSNPDLRNLKAAGGKLMIIQGWEDSGLPGPPVTVDYYEMAERIMGGRASTQESVSAVHDSGAVALLWWRWRGQRRLSQLPRSLGRTGSGARYDDRLSCPRIGTVFH